MFSDILCVTNEAEQLVHLTYKRFYASINIDNGYRANEFWNQTLYQINYDER